MKVGGVAVRPLRVVAQDSVVVNSPRPHFRCHFIVAVEGKRGDYGLEETILSIKSFFCRAGAIRNREGTTLEGRMS